MPVGCIFSLSYRQAFGGGQAYIWKYSTECPLEMEGHSVFMPMFQFIRNTGQGFGGYSGGAIIIINDGRVNVICRAVVRMFANLCCARVEDPVQHCPLPRNDDMVKSDIQD